MKRLLLSLLSIFSIAVAYAQPDLSRYPTQQDKLKAIVRMCDSLSNVENYKEEKKLARYGLKLTSANDWHHLFVFNLYLGFTTPEPDSATYFYEHALGYARKTKKPIPVIEVLARLMYSYNRPTYQQKRTAVAKEMEAMLDTAKSEDVQRGLYSSLANYYESLGAYDKEIQYFIKYIEISKKLLKKGKFTPSQSTNLGVAILGLTELYNQLEQPEKAIQYALESRPLLTGYKDGISHFYKNMASAYLSLKKPKDARVYYDSLRLITDKDYGVGWSNVIAIQLSFGEFFLSQNLTDSARQYIDAANALSPKWGDEYLQSEVDYMTGKVLVARKKYTEALPLLKKSETLCKDAGIETYASLLQSIAECYTATGDYRLASEYYQKYVPLRDSLYSQASRKSLADAEGKYQNQEKQQQIELKNLQIDDANRHKLWLASGIGFLAIALGLLGVIYRNKQKNAEILNAKNLELAKVNNDLEEANHTKAKLFSIISHDLRSPISQVYQFLKLQQLNPDLLSTTQKADLNNRIQTATGSLLETMEDLLLWSKTQMSQFKTDIQTVPLLSAVQQCEQLLQLNSEARNIVVENNIPRHAVIETDPNYFQTIIRNLLQNAIKAAPESSVVKIDAVPEGDTVRAITISNTGKPFTQQQYEEALSGSGLGEGLSGLGLRIVDELSRKIGATVQFINPEPDMTVASIDLR